MPKSYRIRTQVGVDKYINVNLEQDWESLEILSLKILANDVYTRFCSDYGVVTGRVFVNNGFGIPNAKVSVFIPLEAADELDPVITELYPFKNITDTTEEGYRYNLLPKIPSYDGHVSTGSFPNKADVLMDGSYIEVFDKYYRFTVTTNESGDFMIFGVPVGTQTIVMDVDLSDIGCFSLSPQDLILQGLATETQVNGARFKSSTNLQELPQIKNLVFDVDVKPFWGDNDLCQVGITRVDFDLTKQANLTIQPTAIFLGSIISTTDDDALKVSCKPKNNTGNLCEVIAGPGEVQAIRQTIFSDANGLPILERYEFEEGGRVIDGDGTYLVNVPMNLDYVYTNEFGEQVLSNDPKIGVPTKGKYRFRFRWQNDQGLQASFLRADFLVPNIKEYGWVTSSDDPFDPDTITTYNYPTIPTGQTSGVLLTIPSNFGLSISETDNVESYQILINGEPYIGSLNSIQISNGDTFQIIATPLDPNNPQNITFTQYPQQLFNVFKSYAFSTDWDDYVNIQDAIDCEDTFYEFKYNKVYTTAMFLDRYKNGLGRAKHLGIKEIDNRSCKSTVNTFPVNDIIRNFDPIFFVFNILINILTFPILVILFVAHLIALLWPVLKYLLLFLGPYIVYQGVSSAIDLVYYITSLGDFAPIGGPVISIGTILQIIAQAIKSLALIAAGVVFTAFYTKFLIDNLNDGKVDNFPRIGLPMITYSDCTSCDCDCGNAVLDDDFDENSIQQELQAAQNNLDSPAGGLSYELTVSQPNSPIAPVNSPGAYVVEHPNLLQINGEDPFSCPSLQGLIADDKITSDVAVRAALDYVRMISGYDVLSSTDPYNYLGSSSSPTQVKALLHAPQPFLWSANEKDWPTPDQRYFAFPNTVTLSHKLNEFNTRDKYFYKDTLSSLPGDGVNRIKTYVNPSINTNPNQYIEDQVLVVLMNAGTSGSIGVGNLCTFQDPNYVQIGSDRYINLTGATLNQFNNNSITGTTFTGQTGITITYADPNNPTNGIPTVLTITGSSVSQLPVNGNPYVEQSYLQYPTDIEYFQLITGITVAEVMTISNQISSGYGDSGYFPRNYLLHDFGYIRPNCDNTDPDPYQYVQEYINNVVTKMTNYENYEVCIFVRGVDPNTVKQKIKYDLSKILGSTSYGYPGAIIEGDYYLNIPIQPTPSISLTGPTHPASHNTPTNVTNEKLYFPSYTFQMDLTQFTGFTSDLPYYYLCTDDYFTVPGVNTYVPYTSFWSNNQTSTLGNYTKTFSVNVPPGGSGTGGYKSLPQSLNTSGVINNPTTNLNPYAYSQYMVGGSYMRYDENFSSNPFYTEIIDTSGNNDQQKEQYFNNNSGFINQGGSLTALYSAAYYRYPLPGVNFVPSQNIVMRSDRIPTSTRTQDGFSSGTGYGLHQNDNFAVYTVGAAGSPPTIIAGGDLASGESYDEDEQITGLTSSLTCEGMVPLECYSGSGSNVGIIPSSQCAVPANRMINGCYCLLNKKYVKEYRNDANLFLEWKVRFTMNFAACRGVFAQVFQNNWINGVLYMYSFNKRALYDLDPTEPTYKYCDDVILFNELTNTFHYRSSPWNQNSGKFIGKDSPQPSDLIPQTFLDFPGVGRNVKQIQFPTTVVDLGPRDSFINEVCCGGDDTEFGSYYANQLKTTSYQDNADIVQLGFLSRILNEGVRQRIIPITQGGNSSEGKGIVQFFNSTRGGYRIDGDWAQMLSINSEWKVLPFVTENIPSNDYIYFGSNNASGDQNRPVMGLFFSSSTEDQRYRKIMAPGIETYSFNPLLESNFGYPKSQVVPNYRWWLKKPLNQVGSQNIFGSEDNNWYTDVFTGGTFYSKKYQELNFTGSGEKYITQTTQLGYITNYDLNDNPAPIVPLSNITQGSPSNDYKDSVVVGAPYHFYFGLNNGKTAINRFYKLYVDTNE